MEQMEQTHGQTVVPKIFTKTTIKDGNKITQQVLISGPKFLLEDILKNLLTLHTKCMRLTADEEFANMELNEMQ